MSRSCAASQTATASSFTALMLQAVLFVKVDHRQLEEGPGIGLVGRLGQPGRAGVDDEPPVGASARAGQSLAPGAFELPGVLRPPDERFAARGLVRAGED